MASRNVKPSSVKNLDSSNVNDRMQSSTVKRQPSPDWSKTDLLRLLSYFEGELQARDITIATLKAEKAKQLLYQAKYGRFGLGDPFIALQRDSEGKSDACFDEMAIKSMYDNQLAQLENLIATQRKAQQKMREQLGNSEKRFHKVCTELEEEKQKHAQDTAQGDDVTYMLEKERERLKAEIDFEKNQNKKLEKDLKKTLASLEEERANAARHKQVAIMLIKERKNLIECVVAESQLRDEAEAALTDDKSRMQNMAEGIAEESKKSLKMEAAMGKQHSKFDAEREDLRLRLQEEEKQTNILRAEVDHLSKQLESLQQQVRSSGSSPSGTQIRSSVSPARAANPSLASRSASAVGVVLPSSGSTLQSVSSNLNNNPSKTYSPDSSLLTAVTGVRPTNQGSTGRTNAQPSLKATEGGRNRSGSPEQDVILRSENASVALSMTRRSPGIGGMRLGPAVATGVDHGEVDIGSAARVAGAAQGGSKVLPQVAGVNLAVTAPPQTRKAQGFSSPSGPPQGRGTAPPIPPNKPNYVSPGPAKPSPPPKVSVIGPGVLVQSSGKDIHSGQSSQVPVKSASQQSSRVVQIPINVIGGSAPDSSLSGSGNIVGSVRTQVRETSPSSVRKTSQCVVDSTSLEHPSATHAVVVNPGSRHALEFLGPEMANLQKLLAAMTTEEASGTVLPLTDSPPTTVPQSSALSSSLSTPTLSANLPLPRWEMLAGGSADDQNPAQSRTIRNTSDADVSDVAVQEQNNNVSLVNHEFKSITRVTAQISPSPTKSGAFHIPQSNEPSANVLLVQNSEILSLIGPARNALNASQEVSPTVYITSSASSQNITSRPNLVAAVSPSVKRRSLSSRPRSRSPMKMPHNHFRSNSASARPSAGSQTTVTLHNHGSTPWFLSASQIPSLRLSPSMEVQRSPVHHASALGNVEALHKILTEHRSDVNLALKDGTTPLHCAAENHQEAAMKVLLENGAKPSSLRDDKVTPLHMAALRGYAGCLRLLLSKGAGVNLSTAISQTSLHLSVKAGHLECCQLLLRHGANILLVGQDGLTSLHYAVQNSHPEMLRILLDRLKSTGASRDSDTAHRVVTFADKDGWTITHMAAHLPKKDCLVMLTEYLPLDFYAKDKLGRSARMIASDACKEFMVGTVDQQPGSMLKVTVELRSIQESTTVFSFLVGVMEIGPGIGWRMMEDRVRGTLQAYLAHLDMGLKTRRITRLDTDSPQAGKDFTLGLTMTNIKHFEIGFYKWTPGMQTDTSPYLMLSNSDQKKVIVTVEDSDNMCELIAFDVLHPVSSIGNYLRLLEQYKSVIFYGPAGSGKSYLAYRLSQSIAAQELSHGRKPAIHQLSLHAGYTFANFLAFLKQKSCVVPVGQENEDCTPILLLDNLEAVDIARLFGELLDPMEYRGKRHAFSLRGDSQGNSAMYYLVDRFYLIGTMNKSRSLGVDLSILPRFRWVQFRLDTEPMRGLLARHFLRRIFNVYHGCLPSPDDPVFRAIEWIVCIGQRLNDSLSKFGIPEVVQGPCMFFKCPLEKQDHKVILEWMKDTWNHQIAPRVRDSVKRGTGSEPPSDGQTKVANTALYLLMQHSVILNCPLSGQEKDAYFAGFFGSNELDIPLKSGAGKPRGTSLTSLNSNTPQSTQQRRPSSIEPASGQSRKSEGESFRGTSPSASAFKMRNRNSREEEQTDSTLPLASNIKRRSLSDSSVNKAAQLEQQQQFTDSMQTPTSSHAKMAKLEVKSPKIVSIVSAFRSPTLSSTAAPESRVSVRKTGRVSPLLTLVVNSSNMTQKKSKSSENISNSGLPGRLRSPGPFSFSLATPTSSLSSFKFLDKVSSERDMSVSEQMPDFSVFNKVPTPTDELSPSHKIVFHGRSETKENSPGVPGRKAKGNEKEEIWSRRTDVFVPIYRPGGEGDQGRDESRNSVQSTCI